MNESMDVSVGLSSAGSNLGLALEDESSEAVHEVVLSLDPVELALITVTSQAFEALEHEFKRVGDVLSGNTWERFVEA